MKPPEIRILPDDVANKIAAGEVVERPASVVKELLENSVDAGATRIDVEFKHGGKTFIKVLDNGCGMTRQQALMSLEQHATSKIANPDDLFKISTYGFRGEAVPSIASVSKFRLRTRPEGEAFGAQIDACSGKILSVKECGMARGTEILVENLFAGVPARRKFLKGDGVEAGHIARLCRLYALALPQLSITLVENSKVLFRSEGGLGAVARVAKIFGGAAAENLVELKASERDGMKVSGAILSPGESFATSRNICSFINGRPVECRAVYSAVKEAYSQFVPKGRFAGAFLFLELDPASVDVNVHPAKREVRLKNEFAVREFLIGAISERLGAFSFSEPFGRRQEPFGNASGNAEPFDKPPEPHGFGGRFESAPPRPRTVLDRTAEPLGPAAPALGVREPSAALDAPPPVPKFSPPPAAPLSAVRAGTENARAPLSAAWGWRYIGCAARRFALFETPKSLAVMSVLAALRRVGFNRIMKSLEGRKATSQKLLLPATIGFSPADDEFFRANRGLFESCGFEIDDFGKGYYRISAAPAWLEFSETEKFVRDIVESSAEGGIGRRNKRLGDEIFAAAAAARIGMGGFSCTEESAVSLLSELLECPMHMTSPDGRKTLYEISHARLLSLFGENS